MAVPGDEAVGGKDAQAEALTVVLPLKWWGRAYLTGWFFVLRRSVARSFAFSNVDRLRFISAIRWSLLPPFAPQRSLFRRPEQRWQLLFESNFDGDWDEYLDAFGAVLGLPLRSIIWAGVGYPGLTNPRIFKAYARVHDHTPDTYTSAYRQLTAGDIRQELAARYGREARAAIVKEGYGRTAPRWSTILLPITPGKRGVATHAVLRLEEDDRFVTTDDIHFARVSVLDRPSGSWLLLTLTHDGDVAPILGHLVAADGEPPPGGGEVGALRSLLECMDGVPVPSTGWWGDAELVDYLLAHRPASARTYLAYCAYPKYTVDRIKSFVDDARRLASWPVPDTRP